MSEINIEGMFCHIPNENGGWYQGRILDVLPDGSFVVQPYEWLFGEPTDVKVFAPLRLDGASLYDTQDEWRSMGDALMKQTSDEFRGLQ